MKPLAIDLFCGLGGWTDGLLAEGYRVIGYDIEEHAYGEHRYQGELVLQDVLTVHGSAFKDAALIVASPPCQEYSYMAMPWSRAKQIAAALRGQGDFPDGYRGSRTIDELNVLFNSCFRIQREASEAAGRHIPLVVENVKGAQPWVGRARWAYGSFFLWGDVPALLPIQKYHSRQKVKEGEQWNINRANFTGTRGWDDGSKNNGGSWFNIAHNKASGCGRNPDGRKTRGHANIRDGHSHTRHLTNQAESDAIKNGGDWFGSGPDCSLQRRQGSRSTSRKAASALIAKIPEPLSRHIARTFLPAQAEAA